MFLGFCGRGCPQRTQCVSPRSMASGAIFAPQRAQTSVRTVGEADAPIASSFVNRSAQPHTAHCRTWRREKGKIGMKNSVNHCDVSATTCTVLRWHTEQGRNSCRNTFPLPRVPKIMSIALPPFL